MNDIEIQTTLFDQDPLWEAGGDLPGALEALFVASGEVLDLSRLRELTGLGEGPLRMSIEALQQRLQPPRGLRLVEVGGGWRMATAHEYTKLVSKLVTTIRSGKLTPAQIEVLAIIAYRQPISVPEINEMRSVTSSSSQVKTLLERDMVTPAGRKHVVGRPMMYATTQNFLVHFGLRTLGDLPRLEDFGEGKLEAQALASLEPPLPEGGLFDQGEIYPEERLHTEEELLAEATDTLEERENLASLDAIGSPEAS